MLSKQINWDNHGKNIFSKIRKIPKQITKNYTKTGLLSKQQKTGWQLWEKKFSIKMRKIKKYQKNSLMLSKY
jgi:hypothetical protein